MRWSQAVEGYWLERRRDLSPATVSEYTVWFGQFGAFVGDKELDAITTNDVRAWLNERHNSLADKSLSNAWIALSSFWTWAEHELGTPHVIRCRIKQPTFRPPKIQPYSQADIEAMLAAVAHNSEWTARNGRKVRSQRSTALRDRAILLVLLDAGLRASELCALKVEEYTPSSGRLFVAHGKGDKERVVYIGEGTRRALWQYMARRKEAWPAEPLFPTHRRRHMGRRALLRMITGAAGRAGVEHATVHRFRHTFAINFLRNGGNVLALQELLGHESMTTVRIYARLAEIDLAAAQRRASPVDNWRL